MPPAEPIRPARDETIYLLGTNGHPNYGDELVAAAWLRFLARQRPEAEVWLDCPDPGLASHLFRDLHPRLRTTNVLWRVAWETTDRPRDEAEAHVDRVLTELGTPRLDLGLLGARRASTVHVLGGGYVNAVWPTHLMLLRAALRLKDLSGARLLATGHSFLPALDKDVLGEHLAGFDHVSVRDHGSAELTGAPLVGDDALLDLPTLPGYREGTYAAGVADGDVWVCLQSDRTEPETFDAAVAAVRAALTSPPLAGRPVHYLEALPGVDRIAFDRLRDLIPEERFLPFVRLWEEGFPARSGQTWLTSRFHVHLLAAAAGAEGNALPLSEDYEGLHRSLVEMGSGWAVTPTGSKEPATPSSVRGFRSAAASLHKDKLREAQQVYPPLPKAVEEPAPEPPAARPSLLRRR